MANRGFEYRAKIALRDAGRPLLEFLSTRYPHSTESEWRERIASGLIAVDGRTTEPGIILSAGQQIVWSRPPWEEPEVPGDIAVLHRDRDILAVVKPAGLPTLPGAGFLENTLLAKIRRQDPTADPMHRLGRWTSGVLIFARNGAARAALAGLFRDRRVVKFYRCLADGVPDRSEFEVDDPIGRVDYAPVGRLWAATPDGRPSRTGVRVLRVDDGRFLADVRILTGRPHQIRIHLAVAGHPLSGDPLYDKGGIPKRSGRALPGDPGYTLHARRVVLPHPRTGAPLDLRCAPPPELRISARPSTSERDRP